MSFDRYFEHNESPSVRNENSDDWYHIVEEALCAADVASKRHRQQLELSMAKPLPMIPENDADSIRDHNLATRPVTVIQVKTPQENNDQSKDDFAHSVGQRYHSRSSSIYSIDHESPSSPESDDLDNWAMGVCHTRRRDSMSSLRSKPYARPSSFTSSSSTSSPVSGHSRSKSAGSSITVHSRSKSTSSSVYSTDTSINSHASSAKSVCTHSRNDSAMSGIPSKHQTQVKAEKVNVNVHVASTSFFDFSDDEGEAQEEVTVARVESSASNYVKHLRKKALSLRIATSKKAQARVKTMSFDGPALSSWLFRSSSLARRLSRVSVVSDEEMALENELMAGAANSARARRVPGLHNART